VQVDPIKPTLKAPGIISLKLKYHNLLSNFAFKFNLRRYTVGEMSLLTGAPVAATVRALRGHVDVLEISHSALARIMSRRPTLVDDLARVIADKAGG
jgi:CRP-like cAMP-binding protein